MRPNVTNMSSKECFIGISLGGIKKHGIVVDQNEFKKLVLSAKGSIKASLPFLNDVSQETVVKGSNSWQRKCYRVPHSSISSSTIKKLIGRG